MSAASVRCRVLIVLTIGLAGCASPATPTPSVSGSASLPSPQPSESASPAAVTTTPLPSGIAVLTSPPPPPAAGLADPNTPAYAPGTGFTPDAVKVLTIASLQIGLERYRAALGSYPRSLDALFPSYAPIGQDGRPMSGPPAAADGYAYTGGGSHYRLSVLLASGLTDQVEGPN